MVGKPHTPFVRGRLLLISAIISTLMLAGLWQSLSAQELDPRPPDLTNSEKQVDAAQALPGDVLQYAIEISNEGTETAAAVTMTDPLPSGLQLITESLQLSGGGTMTYSGNVITWTGAVNNGAAIQLHFDAQITDTIAAGTWITNTAFITGTGELIAPSAGTQVVSETDFLIFMPVWLSPVPQPPVPSLAPISGPNAGNTWTVSWSVNNNTYVDEYELQQSHDPDFDTVDTYNTTESSQDFNHPASPFNTYYYRVRSIGPAGISDWSQVRSITGNYRDDFKSDTTGWTIRRQDLDDTENYSRYQNNHFVMEIDGRWDYGIGAPMAMAPAAPFAIETSVRLVSADNLNSYGIIWGADYNGGDCTPVRANVNNCFTHYYRLNIIWFGSPDRMHYQLSRIDSHDPMNNTGRGPNLLPFREVTVNTRSEDYQVWRVEHHANGDIKLFVNGDQFDSTNDTTYLGDRYFGVFASSDEYLGSEPWFDWYSVTMLEP